MSIYSNLPIAKLDSFRTEMAKYGLYYKIRYRGPRNTSLDAGRSAMSRASTCLKANAKTFSVYLY